MTWQLGSKPGVVDAIDKYGRPMAAGLPCGCGLMVDPHVCDQGRGCPMNEPTTEPGPLAEVREVRPPAGTEYVWVIALFLFLGLGYIAGRLWP